MTDHDYDTPPATGWIRPCESASCLEVAPHHGGIAIRDSDDPHAVIWATRDGFAAFIAAAKAGKYDHV